MAAHPFGPIENQLIVGYYKRGFDPTRVKVSWKRHEVLVPNSQHNPIHHILQPVFYGWSPANGNSSSHDLSISNRFELLTQSQLLSRGLGYRITFTMPSKEIDRWDPSTAPTIQTDFLDYFGETVLFSTGTLSIQKFSEHLPLFYLEKYNTLMFEVTPLHLKLVENGTTEYVFPTFAKLSSESMIYVSRLENRHFGFVGSYIKNDQYSLVRYCKDLLFSFTSIIDIMTERIETLAYQKKDQIIRKLWDLTQLIVKIWETFRSLTKSIGIPVSEFNHKALKLDVFGLAHIEGQLDGVEGLSRLKRIRTLVQPFLDDIVCTDSNSPIHTLRWDAHRVENRWRFQFSLKPSFELLRKSIIICKERTELNFQVNRQYFETKTFQMSVVFGNEFSGSKITLTPKKDPSSFSWFLYAPNRDTVLVPKTDYLLQVDDVGLRKPKIELYNMLSIYKDKIAAVGGTHSIHKVSLPPFERHCKHHSQLAARWVSIFGVSLVTIPKTFKTGTPRLSYFWFSKNSQSLIPPKADWAELECDKALVNKAGFLSWGERSGAVYQSPKSQMIHFALWFSFGTILGHLKFLLYCAWFNPQTKTLQLKANTVFTAPANSSDLSLVWLDYEKSRTSNTYACVFTSDRLLDIWVCHQNKFSPIRQGKPSLLTNLKLTVCYHGRAAFALLKHQSHKRLTTGYDSYLFGRLYLKY